MRRRAASVTVPRVVTKLSLEAKGGPRGQETSRTRHGPEHRSLRDPYLLRDGGSPPLSLRGRWEEGDPGRVSLRSVGHTPRAKLVEGRVGSEGIPVLIRLTEGMHQSQPDHLGSLQSGGAGQGTGVRR